jgi:hypothetical protein
VIEHPAAPAAVAFVLVAVASAEAIAAIKRVAGEPALPMSMVAMSVAATPVVKVFFVVMTHSALVSKKAGAGSLG